MNQLTNLLLHRRLGIYWVDDKPFVNKVDAFIEASKTGKNVRWDFNEDIFSAIDWKIPVETSLIELYKQRAQQLRDKYDYVSLFFSGGVDSTNALHAFIDNNILLDEIVMFRPKCFAPDPIDTSNRNLYGEIEYAALPHLKEHLKNSRTVVRFIDMDTVAHNAFNNENLYNQIEVTSNLNSTSFIKPAMCLTDPVWNDLYQAGKNVCHIQGIDKPHIKIIDGKAYFRFVDMISFNFTPRYHTAETEMIRKHQFHELFYWTPDLPQLVIKQCQIVKRLAQNETYRYILENTDRMTQEKFEFITQYIYPEHVANSRKRLAVVKPGYTQTTAGMHEWFFETMDGYTIGAHKHMIEQMKKLIDDRFFVCVKNIYTDDPTLTFHGFKGTTFRMSRSKLYAL